MPPRRCVWAGVAALLLAAVICRPASAGAARPLEFHVAFDRAVSSEPFTGRVYVLLSQKEFTEPPSGPNWFHPEPFFAVDVRNWKPGETLTVGADALGYPGPLTGLAPGTYYAQAVMDFDRGGRSFAAAEGNGYGRPVKAELDSKAGGAVDLTVDQVYHARAFAETDRVKLVDVESKLLTAFYGAPTHVRAGVVLPKSFAAQPERRYPVVYEIPGFGGTHFGAFGAADRNATDLAGAEAVWVVLDPSCRLGHHVFADSANNGPRGRALVESLSPDPVDFRDFQRIDLTRPGANLYTDADGKPRPLARTRGKPLLYFKPFSDMETVMGHGGQLASFEAVFSPRGADGRPRSLWDRKDGAVDPETARAWEQYDIRLKIEREWKTLGPKLAGKLHVYTGAEDTFYLEGAVRLLQQSLKDLGSDAEIEIVPGKDHSSLVDRKMRERIAREMGEAFRRTHPG